MPRPFALRALLAALCLVACGTSSVNVPGASTDGGVRSPEASIPETSAPDASTPEASPDSAVPPTLTTTIRVHYPAGSHTISLRASVAPWTWTSGVAMTAAPNDTWTLATTTPIAAPFELKPLLDDATWSLGPNYKAVPGTTVDIYPHFTQTKGSYSRAFDFTSPTLGNTRGIWIYEPPTYIENTRALLPVLYMHDGQNLFDPTVAFGGNAWNVAQTMDAGALDGSIADTIVIGVENTSDRINEYTPVPDPQTGGGKGDLYLNMLTQELKPQIDARLRTLPDRAHTSMMGSSLGGLITAYAGVTRSNVFGLVGAMSPSTWWDNQWIIGDVATTPATPRPLRVYVDSGDSGPSNDDVLLTKQLAAEYATIGYAAGSTLDYVVQAGGQHNEIYWAQRLPVALAFLLGSGR